jgi:hypothetical protein
MAHRISSIGIPAHPMPERDPTPKSAFDKDREPYYGEGVGEARDGQHVEGHGFAGLRADMDKRRRQTARRMNADRDCY